MNRRDFCRAILGGVAAAAIGGLARQLERVPCSSCGRHGGGGLVLGHPCRLCTTRPPGSTMTMVSVDGQRFTVETRHGEITISEPPPPAPPTSLPASLSFTVFMRELNGLE